MNNNFAYNVPLNRQFFDKSNSNLIDGNSCSQSKVNVPGQNILYAQNSFTNNIPYVQQVIPQSMYAYDNGMISYAYGPESNNFASKPIFLDAGEKTCSPEKADERQLNVNHHPVLRSPSLFPRKSIIGMQEKTYDVVNRGKEDEAFVLTGNNKKKQLRIHLDATQPARSKDVRSGRITKRQSPYASGEEHNEGVFIRRKVKQMQALQQRLYEIVGGPSNLQQLHI